MHHHLAPQPLPRPTTSGRRVVRAAALLVAVALTLGACGLRLETPPPAEPSPDPVEQVRARTVDDALGLVDAAFALSAADVVEPVRAVLDDVAEFSTRHAQELGGVYDSGLPETTPTATPHRAMPAVTDVTGLLRELVDDAARASGDADAVPDPELARLVASIAVARDGLADRLASATGQSRPEPAAAQYAGASPDGAAPDVADDGSTAAAAGDGVEGGTPTPAPATTPEPGGAPEGAAALALAHDEAAWTFTVLAARVADDRRAALLGEAARHRAASDAWAHVAGVVGQPTDPRRAAYALPAAVDDPAAAEALPRTLETAVADASANVVAGAAQGQRRDAVAGLRAATTAAVAWGAAPVPFPGMPELAAVPEG
ncbi:DUF4439 domain-containing protein [Cellulomonas sp. S1-8]|uniref:DUF4439 domain-containing protein n=1 Tax=Cellulomonas sp. S1-8 TaxID=2904790 RepID=UPI002243E944|nr:DUF4439 domain-containing protein [Cellulomonas sp. S1-8]UZN04865.1 DUF4439 domain-containing protein [Cellulomonas sp. S1-8]